MLVTELYSGQGLGNQLWSYVVTRVLALDRGLEFGIMSPQKFKGADFMDPDFGREVRGGAGPEGGPPERLPDGITNYYVERDTWHPGFGCDIRDHDEGLLAIPDNTKIEGYFQSEKFIAHRRGEIRGWLKVRPESDIMDFSSDDLCVMNVRGGEYRHNPDLILPRKYWTDAAANMRREKPGMRFVVVTDDVKYARKLLPEFEAYHLGIGRDYAAVKNARYLVLANSSFAFFPAWTSETVRKVIAPKYWARHNVSDGFWACAFNLYRDWLWQDRDGELRTYEQCAAEYERYRAERGLASFGPKPAAPRIPAWRRRLQRTLDSASRVKRRLLDL
ncbi:MAG: glycosyl transferase [Elusimicrobia bacterium]|nr:glycosyl transferase [Elusimicrobiota bacterium]